LRRAEELMMRAAWMVAVYAMLAGCAETSTGPRTATRLPVTRAVLYQNGIGYFERRGKLDDDVLRIRVRPDQIRDVLKSLTVVDLSAGRPVSIALPIEKSRLKQLSELPEQVRTEGGLLALVRAFRGARCEISGEGAGRIGQHQHDPRPDHGVVQQRLEVRPRPRCQHRDPRVHRPPRYRRERTTVKPRRGR
jgi:hypothetical protein